jgi:hypothetical protein
VHAPGSEWPQCEYPLAAQGIICKHVIKIYKMFHPTILNGVIVQENYFSWGAKGIPNIRLANFSRPIS